MEVKLLEEPIIGNIINNSSFNKDIWINKFNLIKENKNELGLEEKERSEFFKKENKGIFKTLDVMNFLNNSKFTVNKNILNKVTNDYFLLERLKKDKRIMTMLSIKEAEFLSKFEKFHFDYVMDNRTRLYIKNIPLNTQLEKILRPLVITDIDTDGVILNNHIRFLKEFKEIIKIEDLFSSLRLNKDDINIIINLIDNKLKNKNIKTEKLLEDLKNKKLSIELIFFQQVHDILEKFDIDKEEMRNKEDLDDIVMEYGIKE
jgi:hypothetical protein